MRNAPEIPRFTLALDPIPTGPRTLEEEIHRAAFALQMMERSRHGNGFLPPGSIERARRNLDDLRARYDLTREARPELHDLYAQHQILWGELGMAGTQGEILKYQDECAELARKIVELEDSVDLG